MANDLVVSVEQTVTQTQEVEVTCKELSILRAGASTAGVIAAVLAPMQSDTPCLRAGFKRSKMKISKMFRPIALAAGLLFTSSLVHAQNPPPFSTLKQRVEANMPPSGDFKFAVAADVNARAANFRATLIDARAQGAAFIVLTGDTVWGLSQAEIIAGKKPFQSQWDFLKADFANPPLPIVTVVGNHDQSVRVTLDATKTKIIRRVYHLDDYTRNSGFGANYAFDVGTRGETNSVRFINFFTSYAPNQMSKNDSYSPEVLGWQKFLDAQYADVNDATKPKYGMTILLTHYNSFLYSKYSKKWIAASVVPKLADVYNRFAPVVVFSGDKSNDWRTFSDSATATVSTKPDGLKWREFVSDDVQSEPQYLLCEMRGGVLKITQRRVKPDTLANPLFVGIDRVTGTLTTPAKFPDAPPIVPAAPTADEIEAARVAPLLRRIEELEAQIAELRAAIVR